MTHEELVENGKQHGFTVYQEGGDITVAAFEYAGKTYKLGFREGEKDDRNRDALAFNMRASIRRLNEGENNNG